MRLMSELFDSGWLWSLWSHIFLIFWVGFVSNYQLNFFWSRSCDKYVFRRILILWGLASLLASIVYFQFGFRLVRSIPFSSHQNIVIFNVLLFMYFFFKIPRSVTVRFFMKSIDYFCFRFRSGNMVRNWVISLKFLFQFVSGSFSVF